MHPAVYVALGVAAGAACTIERHVERHAFALRFLGILTSYGFGMGYRGCGPPVQRLWPHMARIQVRAGRA